MRYLKVIFKQCVFVKNMKAKYVDDFQRSESPRLVLTKTMKAAAAAAASAAASVTAAAAAAAAAVIAVVVAVIVAGVVVVATI